ncbi:MAG: hypothetical protein P1P85_02710 [Patescibacteria group bacterium]|nr:hypothetical protein [Patescibacteria group bacterium]
MKILKIMLFLTVISLSFTITNNEVKAATDLGNYIKVKLDIGDAEIFEGKSSTGTASTFDITATSYSPGATTYECAILLTEQDNTGYCSDEYITWAVNQNILGKGNSLNADTGLGRINCCGGSNSACKKDWSGLDPCGDRCTLTESESGAGDVLSQNYGVFWTDKCSSGDCELLSGTIGYGRNYSFQNEIVCETTWKRCDDAFATCYTYNGRQYACTGAAGGMTWDNCTASGKTCVAGACVDPLNLTLTATANPTTISAGLTSIITFKVTKGGSNISGATVNGISVTAGIGNVSAASCVTNASGECTVTYTNAPAGNTIATINATDASDGINVDSGSASTMVTVASGNWLCDTSGNPDYSDACSGFPTIIDTCASLNGAGPGCVGVWQNCGSSCNVSCSGACGSCFTPYQACNCECGPAGPPIPTCVPVPEVCNDGIDNDCDGIADCFDTVDCPNGSSCGGIKFCDSGKCVECLTNADCGGTDICNDSGNCQACISEGTVSTNPAFCCSGLNLVAGVCTSGCDPNAAYFCNPARSTVETLVQGGEKMIGYILGIIGSVALLLIIIAGIMYITAAGAEEKITSAKKILTGAIIGLGIALLSFSLLEVVMTVLNM